MTYSVIATISFDNSVTKVSSASDKPPKLCFFQPMLRCSLSESHLLQPKPLGLSRSEGQREPSGITYVFDTDSSRGEWNSWAQKKKLPLRRAASVPRMSTQRTFVFPYVLAACNLTPQELSLALSNLPFVSTFHLSHSLFSFSQLFCKSTPVYELTWSGSCFSLVQEFGGQAESESEPERRLEEKEQVMGSRPAEQSGSYEGEGSGMPQDVSARGERTSKGTLTIPSGDSPSRNISKNWIGIRSYTSL